MLLLFTVLIPSHSYSQDFGRVEVGLQTSTCLGCFEGRWSAGPEVTFNINQYMGVNGTVGVSTITVNSSTENSGGRSAQLLVGPKVSIRSSRFSFFAKARPGLVTWSHAITGLLSSSSGFPTNSSFGTRNLFAFNSAGGFQYGLGRRLSLSTELGDTVVRQVNGTGVSQYTNNIQFATGLTYQFGSLADPHHEEKLPRHRFFDRYNILLLTADLLAQTADALTTQRSLSDCRRNAVASIGPFDCAHQEGDPLFRPFVTHGWGGQVAISGIVTSAEVLLMYGIHKMGYHTVERVVPVAQAIASSQAAYSNLQKY
jgi:hypothetical protein